MCSYSICACPSSPIQPTWKIFLFPLRKNLKPVFVAMRRNFATDTLHKTRATSKYETATVCSMGGLYIQVPLYINYYSVSLGWSLHTGSAVHQLLQCVPWVVFIYRFHCTSTTTMCPLGGLYMQVPLYINYYNMAHGWSLYTGSTVQQLLQRVSWVVFIDRFHCISPMVHFTTGSISQPNREVGQNQANGPENQALATTQKARGFARGWRI